MKSLTVVVDAALIVNARGQKSLFPELTRQLEMTEACGAVTCTATKFPGGTFETATPK